MSVELDKWTITIREAPNEHSTTLICLCYAGGNPDIFRTWSDGIGADMGLLAIRLPGHGRRVRERPYRSWRSLVEDTFATISPYLSANHAFFGHSFGGRLAYELTHLAAAEYPGRTRRLFVAACRSPNFRQARPYMHRLLDNDFRDALRDMGGTPAEILANKTLMRILLPVVRDEIRLAELWGDRHHKGVEVPITALYGRDDTIDGRKSMRGWEAFSQRACELIEMPGGHFFLDTHRPALLEVINARLEVPGGQVGL